MIVADSGPLIYLARLELLHLPQKLYGKAWLPDAVLRECLLDPALPGAKAIAAALENNHLHKAEQEVVDRFGAEGGLNSGERAALSLALSLSCEALLDEKLARQVASRSGIPVIGTAGLLLKAKQAGLVKAIAPLLHQANEFGYFLSAPLVRRMLELANE